MVSNKSTVMGVCLWKHQIQEERQCKAYFAFYNTYLAFYKVYFPKWGMENCKDIEGIQQAEAQRY